MAEQSGDGGQLVYDPRGMVQAQAIGVAARVRAIDGLRLAVLDNTKWNANRLLRQTTARLQQEFDFAAVNRYRKESFSKTAAPELIEEIVRDNDIALTAIGD